MKKIIYCCLVFSLIFPAFSQAWFLSPYQYVNIIKNTIGGDGDFTFRLIGVNSYYSTVYDLDPTIQTNDGLGQYNSSDIFVGTGGYYLIKEIEQAEWKVKNIGCVNSQYGEIGEVSGEYFRFPAYSYTTTTCTITNEKQAGKYPVLILPGIMGTEIFKGEEKLWPDIPRMINPTKSDAFMDPLSFNSDGAPLDTSLTVGDIIREPYPGHHFYDGIIEAFEARGYQQNRDLFVFAYDWRQDITKTAYDEQEQGKSLNLRKDLAGKIDQILESTGAGEIDIVAHSQGGLVAKRLLFQIPSYQAKIRKLVLVGVPHLGSPQAVKNLLYGDNLSIAKKDGIIRGQLDPDEVKKIAHNMPAVYELLPSPSYFVNQPLGYIYDHYKFYLNTYSKTTDYLKQKDLNQDLIDKAALFHEFEYDNFNLENTGIESYNIAGCEQGTFGTLVVNSDADSPNAWFTAGDGTVQLNSAKQSAGSVNYYVKGALEHSKMLGSSTSSVVSLVSNLITDTILSLPENVVSDTSQCHFNGVSFAVHSPVEMDIYDENGRHVGISDDENNSFVDLQVPGAQYMEIGHNKYAYMPDGHNYTTKLKATGSGTFNLGISLITDGVISKTAYYDSVSVATSSLAVATYAPDDIFTTIQMDFDNSGTIDQIIPPSSILNQNESQDLIPPASTSTIIGLMGQPGYYRSNATITLSALDPVIEDKPEETSGVLKIQYSIDGGEYLVYSTSSPIVITSEGPHSLKFYSTDRAGNNEPAQEVSFVIDKTPPELIISFNPQLKDLEFTATDTLSSIITSTSTSVKVKWPKIPALKFKDSDNIITATDAAGNTIQLEFKDKNRKLGMKAEIKSLKYNGQAANTSKSKLAFVWLYDKKGNLNYLLQNAQSKVGFNILAVYNGSKTTLLGKDEKGLINKTLTGLNVLVLSTVKGDLSWSIKSVVLPLPIVRR